MLDGWIVSIADPDAGAGELVDAQGGAIGISDLSRRPLSAPCLLGDAALGKQPRPERRRTLTVD
jgi:hypothetical protein